MRRWLALAVLAVALTMGLSKASGQADGLSVSVYAVTQIPPTRSDTLYEHCGDTTYLNVSQGWGGGVVASCRSDRVMLHYTGFITLPSDNVRFLLYSDDGGWTQIGEQAFGYWGDRSCQASYSGDLQLSQGSYLFEDWYYENGGGTCNQLLWSVDNQPWEVVPVSAFQMVPPTSPVTTTTSTSTVPPTTTIETTTTTESPSTTVPFTTSTTPETTVLVAMTTLPTTTTVAPTTTQTTPLQTTTTSTVEPTTTTTTNPSTTTTFVQTTLPAQITQQEAVAIATNSEALSTVSVQEANEIFSSLDVTQLTDEEATKLVAAVQNAPVGVRKAFEKHINIFGGKTETYIPLGSIVPVRTRRIIIVTTVVIGAMIFRRRK